MGRGTSSNIITLDIERETRRNTNFRKVISTSDEMQLVLMSLVPGEEIGEEVHEENTQFIRIEEGFGIAILDGTEVELSPNIAVFIPAGMYHNIINTGDTNLQLYTLYAPPMHPHGLVENEKPENED